MGAIFTQAAAEWRAMKHDYDDALEASFTAAEQALNGFLLTRAATLAGVSAWSLFKGPASAAYVHASDELVEWWETHPRLTLAAYERTWMQTRQDQPLCRDCDTLAAYIWDGSQP